MTALPQAQPTPGEWERDEDDHDVLTEGGYKLIATFACIGEAALHPDPENGPLCNWPETEANIRLFLAAKRMLAALDRSRDPGAAAMTIKTYCHFCGKSPRGKLQMANAERYTPYCSYQCQESHRMAQAREHLAEWKRQAVTRS